MFSCLFFLLLTNQPPIYLFYNRIDELIRKKSRTRAKDEAASKNKGGKDMTLANMKEPTLPQVHVLDPPLPPSAAGSGTNYSPKLTPSLHHTVVGTPKLGYGYPGGGAGGNTPQMQHQQPGYGYSPATNAYKPQQQQQQQQQQQEQQGDYDFYQATTGIGAGAGSAMSGNPYATSAFTSGDDEIYPSDPYGGVQDRPMRGNGSGRELAGTYGAGYPIVHSNNAPSVAPKPKYYSGNSTSSSQLAANNNNNNNYNNPNMNYGNRTNLPSPYSMSSSTTMVTGGGSGYNNYGHNNNVTATPPLAPRPASPMMSQHGSDLDSQHSSAIDPSYGYYNRTSPPMPAAGTRPVYGQQQQQQPQQPTYSSQEYHPSPTRRQDNGYRNQAPRGGRGGY